MPADSDPADGSRTTPVVAAVVERGGRYLVGRRPDAKRHGGLWEFPGGKLRAGEALVDAARRELREELGLEVRAVGAERFRVRDPGSPFLIVFVEVEVDGQPVALEHTEVTWRRPEDLRAMPLCPSDARFVEEALRSSDVRDPDVDRERSDPGPGGRLSSRARTERDEG